MNSKSPLTAYYRCDVVWQSSDWKLGSLSTTNDAWFVWFWPCDSDHTDRDYWHCCIQVWWLCIIYISISLIWFEIPFTLTHLVRCLEDNRSDLRLEIGSHAFVWNVDKISEIMIKFIFKITLLALHPRFRLNRINCESIELPAILCKSQSSEWDHWYSRRNDHVRISTMSWKYLWLAIDSRLNVVNNRFDCELARQSPPNLAAVDQTDPRSKLSVIYCGVWYSQRFRPLYRDHLSSDQRSYIARDHNMIVLIKLKIIYNFALISNTFNRIMRYLLSFVEFKKMSIKMQTPRKQ